LFFSGGILLTRLTVDYGLGAYVFTYCILFGLGMGLPYSVIFQVASSWFPDKRATVVGIIASGLGLGALVFTPIQTKLINPNDLQPKAGYGLPCLTSSQGSNNYSVKDALKSIDFYLLWTVSFCDVVAVVLLTSTYKVRELPKELLAEKTILTIVN
uniref:Oxalate:formate antiporter n=1 Tax=Schistocephalus solidus TaxID=70667 RepID=A0A183TM57_SCHSO